jgi:FKBP-type peptidyl-prolyl cis-trans isomerase FkpA
MRLAMPTSDGLGPLALSTALAAALVAGCAAAPPAPDPLEIDYDPALEIELDAMERRGSGLLVRDVVEGAGTEARRGREVVIHYIGSFPDGTVFDSSLAHGETIRFRLGDDEVIRGWDEGIPGMRAGGRRMLIVPPRLGYGARGVPGLVPGNQVLVFEIQLVDVR